ncbi:LEA type 2 family protein [Flavobacteriales bacterium]|nr:LEA type 2 family protein [Flavobacteriales bacterium]MDB4088628.1 LEA type 2 family protein [Flavobacteriales bacterium]
MTKRLNIWVFVIMVFTLTSCSLYEDVEFLGVQDYSFERLEGSEIKASIIFKINNPNFYSIKLKKSDFEIFLDDDKLGSAKMLEDIKIKRKAEGEYTLNLALQESELKNSVVPLLKKAFSKNTVTFRIKGKAHAKVWGILGKKVDINEKKEVSIQDLIKNFKM